MYLVISDFSFKHPHRPSLASNVQKGGYKTFNKTKQKILVTAPEMNRDTETYEYE